MVQRELSVHGAARACMLQRELSVYGAARAGAPGKGIAISRD